MTTQDIINQIKSNMEEACNMAALDDYLDDDIPTLDGQAYGLSSWIDQDGNLWISSIPFHGKIR